MAAHWISDASVDKALDKRMRYHKVTILGENKPDVSSHAAEWYEITVPFHELLFSEFLSKYIKKGAFQAFTNVSSTELSDFLSIGLDGMLFMRLSSALHMTLGIVGKKVLSSNGHAFYEVFVNLKDPTFVPGSPTYNRLIWCFKGRVKPLHLFAFFLDEVPSIAERWNCIRRVNAVKSEEVSCPIPLFESFDFSSSSSQIAFTNWIGAVLCRLSKISFEEELDISSSKPLYVRSEEGILGRNVVNDVVNQAEAHSMREGFAIVVVHGIAGDICRLQYMRQNLKLRGDPFLVLLFIKSRCFIVKSSDW